MSLLATFSLRAPAKTKSPALVTSTNSDTYPGAPQVTESDLFFLTANPSGGKEIQAYRPEFLEWYPVFISDDEREVTLTLSRLLTLPGAKEVKGCGYCKKPVLGANPKRGKRGVYCSTTHLERVEMACQRQELETLFLGASFGCLGFLLLVAILSLMGGQ